MNHVQTSLARAPYNIDDFGAYQAAALSVRDNLIVSYDLLGCHSSHTPSAHMHDNYSPVHVLSPSAFGIPVVLATKIFSLDYRSLYYMRMRRVQS